MNGFMGIPKAGYYPKNMVGYLQQVISVVYGSETSHSTVYPSVIPPEMKSFTHAARNVGNITYFRLVPRYVVSLS